MTTEPHIPEHEAPHEGPIKTPKQLIVALVLSFTVPVIAIIMLAGYVATATKPAAGSDGLSAEAVAQRIEPVGTVVVKDVSDPAALQNGEQVYAAQCAACHATGAAGAPKLGEDTAWAPRIKQGFEALLASALKGKGSMPPQGGGDFTDLEIGRAVVYMANRAGAKFDEPKAAPTQAAAGKEAAPGTAAPAPAAQPAQAAAAAAPQAAAAATPAAAAAAQPDTGGAVPALYAQACQVCHAAGVAGAPKLGDKAAWAPRLAQGIDGLTASAIKGKGAMPPKGGSNASDADIKAVVEYMVGTVK